jgi:hypothetical protein
MHNPQDAFLPPFNQCVVIAPLCTEHRCSQVTWLWSVFVFSPLDYLLLLLDCYISIFISRFLTLRATFLQSISRRFIDLTDQKERKKKAGSSLLSSNNRFTSQKLSHIITF